MFPIERLSKSECLLEAVPFFVISGEHKNKVGLVTAIENGVFTLDTGTEYINVTIDDGMVFVNYPHILIAEKGYPAPQDPQTHGPHATMLNFQQKVSISQTIQKLVAEWSTKKIEQEEDRKLQEKIKELKVEQSKTEERVKSNITKLRKMLSDREQNTSKKK